MLEREVERYFVAQVKKAGGKVEKVKWIGRRGAPDRFVGLNGAHLVELKRPGEKPRPEQLREHDKLRAKGVHVVVIDTKEGVDLFLEEVTNGKYTRLPTRNKNTNTDGVHTQGSVQPRRTNRKNRRGKEETPEESYLSEVQQIPTRKDRRG